jgi:hypothetical protein
MELLVLQRLRSCSSWWFSSAKVLPYDGDISLHVGGLFTSCVILLVHSLVRSGQVSSSVHLHSNCVAVRG